MLEFKFKDCGAYVDIDDDESVLDGHFTSIELREIANCMDKMKEKDLLKNK